MTSDESLREEQTTAFKLFVCVQCGFEYDEAKGWPEDGICLLYTSPSPRDS